MPVTARRTSKTEANERWAIAVFRTVAGEGGCTKDEISEAFEVLERRYSPSTCGLIFQCCRGALPWWPRDLKYQRNDPRSVPVMPARDIAKLIRNSGGIDKPTRARLFLATVYGLRRVELARVGKEDIDLDAGTVFIHTAKKGNSRLHRIPKGLERLLACDIEPKPLRSLTDDLIAIEAWCGVEHVPGRGWHSIRRSLATELARAKVDPLLVRKFMRWAGRSIYEQYYVNLDLVDDEAMFEVHPFLKFWRR